MLTQSQLDWLKTNLGLTRVGIHYDLNGDVLTAHKSCNFLISRTTGARLSYQDKDTILQSIGILPVKFGLVQGDFSAAGIGLLNLTNHPYRVEGNYNISSNGNLKSLDGMPEWIGGDCRLTDTSITSLHDIHKQCKHIGGYICVDEHIQSNILGVLLIDGCRGIKVTGNVQFNRFGDLLQSTQIVNRFVNQNNAFSVGPDKDVLACQHEMIEAGFAKFAKL